MIVTSRMTALRPRSLPPRVLGERYDEFDLSLTGARNRSDRLRIAFLIPLSGPAGLWGPSCQTSAMLASQEVNAAGGILGREIELVFTDAGADPDLVAEDTLALIAEIRAEAVIGMHISAVRVALVRALRGRLPYVYTPVYEGGERSPGLFMVGEDAGATAQTRNPLARRAPPGATLVSDRQRLCLAACLASRGPPLRQGDRRRSGRRRLCPVRVRGP